MPQNENVQEQEWVLFLHKWTCVTHKFNWKGERKIMKQTENEMNVSVPLEVIKASEIEPKEVKWLWYPYIPFGKVTLLQGDPGDGKSKLMLSIAALLSKGEPLPFTDTDETEPMTIIYQTTEDDADDTVVPRFNAAGGIGENLIFIKEDVKSLSFGDNRIAEAIEKYHAKLLILDAYTIIGQSHVKGVIKSIILQLSVCLLIVYWFFVPN